MSCTTLPAVTLFNNGLPNLLGANGMTDFCRQTISASPHFRTYCYPLL
jgi:hypothetical protein